MYSIGIWKALEDLTEVETDLFDKFSLNEEDCINLNFSQNSLKIDPSIKSMGKIEKFRK